MPEKIRILVLIGTRPECIKLAPVIQALRNRATVFEVHVCLTSQHREMLEQARVWLPFEADTDLDLMASGQHLVTLQARILEGVKAVIDSFKPHYAVVQGDTTTAMAGATAACFHHVKVAHVEAGLRTFDRYAPWPEEINRLLISRLAEVHFAPTARNAEQLRKESVDGHVVTVGNTVIDALLQVRDTVKAEQDALMKIETALMEHAFDINAGPYILVTGHRRESLGEGIESICDALLEIAIQHPTMRIVYAVHLNPAVHEVVHKRLSTVETIHLLPPQDYGAFIYLMDRCHFILSDSGGIQEEAPSLDKPVLVMRDATERTDAVDAGAVKLVGTDKDRIVAEAKALLSDTNRFEAMAEVVNPFGDGKSAEHIADWFEQHPPAELTGLNNEP